MEQRLSNRTQRPKLLVQCRGVLRFRDADVHFHVRLGRHNIGARAACNHARIHRDALLQIGERRDFRDLARQLQHRAGACFVIDARVRRLALHGDRVIADAFARGLEFAFESRTRLDEERNSTLPRGLFGELPRSLAADFFVRIHLKQNVPAHRDFEHAQRMDGENEERDARFHVQHAGSPQAALLLAERHVRQRAERPNGIGMRQHQDLAGAGFRARQLELAAQVMPETATWQSLHVCRAVQTAGQKVHEAVDGLRLIARRLASCQLANQCDDGRLLRFRKSKKRMHCLL